MGLDIYLYRYEDYERDAPLVEKFQEPYEEFGIYGDDWEKLNEVEKEARKDAARIAAKRFAEENNLQYEGYDSVVARRESIHQDSLLHPDHLFKVGYFRSSYNDSGIEQVLGHLTGFTMEAMFKSDERYVFRPDWSFARHQCELATMALKRKISEGSNFRAFGVDTLFSRESGVSNEAQAIAAFQKVYDKEKGSAKSKFLGSKFSNKSGDFFIDPLEIYGIIHGTGVFGAPCHYIVHKSDLSSYVASLEIIMETIDFVLSKPDKEKYYLHWSG